MASITRFALLIIFGAALVGAAASRAQPPALDSLRLSLELKDAPLREALQQLVLQTKAQLVYHDAIVAGVKTSCSLKNVTLRQVLEEILTPADLTYHVMDDGLIVIVWRGWMTRPPERQGPPNGTGFGPPPPFGAGGPEFIDAALQGLALSEIQQAKIDSMRNTQREKLVALLRQRQNGELDFEKFRSEHRKLNDEMMQQMQDVLTTEQYKKLEKTVQPQRRPLRGFPPLRPEGGTMPRRPSRRK
ncbi:MAG: STN domain-containing protein [candidate division KSB1 bacterium]|nr:STN domain-containing protein [candidate division KSB1 bacterium]MDZ7367338.1 STN domain-containing protein [candidate division KSB1 bacterium]MDZ7405219.1 STN domain-containing protein [candidate division KSB1 bacterium]